MTTSPGDIIRVAVRHKWLNVDDVVNVFHFTVLGAPVVEVDAQLLVDVSEMVSLAYTEIQGNMPTILTAEDITVYNVTDDYPLGVVNFTSPYAGGTSTADSLPPGNSGLIIWRTATKRVMGKTYLPPFMEANQGGGLINSAALSDMGNFADAIRGPYAGTLTYEFGLGVWSAQAGQMRPITSYAVRQVMAYQRRRRPGSGS